MKRHANERHWENYEQRPGVPKSGLPSWRRVLLAVLAWALIVGMVILAFAREASPAKGEPLVRPIELHIKACYRPDPRVCLEHPPVVFMEPGLTVYACAMRAQIELVKWKEEHPGWYVIRYRCGRAGVMARA
ncbi:hypothetical protein GIW81_00815 [Hyphomicrobium sp. xq]|uniref:Uncharacterized protein n=1 Tax=Hyphomicrobium album TaxID=2665159 RepID=A0A6I3KEZ7_9HYPH|nr:hypothetical protein [Hyphomicrobium album]MTD92869.1 hypothetical protein [Hyphomicrobium album]